MSDLIDYVQEYCDFRGLSEPDEFESLMFLASEVRELCEAFVETSDDFCQGMTENQRMVIEDLISGGQSADALMSDSGEWVRNNDRVKKSCLEDEIGDILMMLTKFSQKSKCKDPLLCMMGKFEKKGFIREGGDTKRLV